MGDKPENGESFEVLYATLEEKARQLEEGGLTLEESVKTYEEGADIALKLRALLDKAELRVRELDTKLGEREAAMEEEQTLYDAEHDGAAFDDDD